MLAMIIAAPITAVKKPEHPLGPSSCKWSSGSSGWVAKFLVKCQVWKEITILWLPVTEHLLCVRPRGVALTCVGPFTSHDVTQWYHDPEGCAQVRQLLCVEQALLFSWPLAFLVCGHLGSQSNRKVIFCPEPVISATHISHGLEEAKISRT